ncbi:MAG: FAD-binding protein [Armatimonadetes bacterium]|nr:FAD-binding protein [Armatimonadota bacterium]
MSESLRPETVEEAAEMVREGGPFRIEGAGTKREFGCPLEGACKTVSTLGLSGIVEWSPDDLVAVVRAGTHIEDLQSEFATRNQWLPFPPGGNGIERLTAGLPGTAGGMVAANLPTRWDGSTKGVRYWVLGMKVVLADGTIVKCGSKAVKNVAGYDVQKLMTGAWGTLGLIVEVILRVMPKPRPEDGETSPFPDSMTLGDDAEAWDGSLPLMIARAPIGESADFARSLGHGRWVLDAGTGTVWASVAGCELPAAPDDGWAFYAGTGKANFGDLGPNRDLALGMKKALDPTRKFNPGILGLF